MIRRYRESDLKRIMTIDICGQYTYWTYLSYKSMLTKLIDCYVCEICGVVVGYMVFYRSNKTASLMNIAVDREYSKHGVASMLITKLCQTMYKLGCNRITLEVMVSNFKARSLYIKFGFTEIGRRANYYLVSENPNLYEDAVSMHKVFYI